MRAVDPLHLGGLEPKMEDPLWRAAREKEYQDALSLLADSGHAIALMNLCVYNERPKFLDGPKNFGVKDRAESLAQVREGLDRLVKLWKRV